MWWTIAVKLVFLYSLWCNSCDEIRNYITFSKNFFPQGLKISVHQISKLINVTESWMWMSSGEVVRLMSSISYSLTPCHILKLNSWHWHWYKENYHFKWNKEIHEKVPVLATLDDPINMTPFDNALIDDCKISVPGHWNIVLLEKICYIINDDEDFFKIFQPKTRRTRENQWYAVCGRTWTFLICIQCAYLNTSIPQINTCVGIRTCVFCSILYLNTHVLK